MKIERFEDGFVILADATQRETMEFVRSEIGTAQVPLIVADPPYGRVVNEKWDKVKETDVEFSKWMIEWTRLWSEMLFDRGAFLCWGGTGKVGFRPFYRYLHDVEVPGQFELANHITWSKKRAYGVQNNYLYTREELAFFIKGNAKKPLTFHVPLLETKRGYAGYNPDFPAKSEYFRRTNIWMDVNEIFRGKVHECEKPQRLHEIIVETHSDPGDWLIDPFAGSGVSGLAARKLGRKFALVENDPTSFELIVSRLTNALPTV